MKMAVPSAAFLRVAGLCLFTLVGLAGCAQLLQPSSPQEPTVAADNQDSSPPRSIVIRVDEPVEPEPPRLVPSTGDTAGEPTANDAPAEPELTSVESLPQIEIDPAADPGEELVKQLCLEIGRKLGSVSREDCARQALQHTGALSVLERSLALREYPPLPGRNPLGRILVIGGIHGDEYSSVSIVFKWMDILNHHHSGLFHWHVVPLANPDGLLREVSQRQNENGVDLNRNFPSSDWDELALDYWVERTGRNDRRFPGTGPASEPEIRWLVEHIEAFQPDIIVSVHAPYHLVDYDGPPQAPQKLGDLYLNRLGVFPGSLGNYAGIDLNTPVVTIELPYAGIMPNDSHINRMWEDLVAWLRAELSKRG